MNPRPNYITPAGYAALKAEYDALFAEERPKLVEIISWAAGNGDRSENGDYIYGRKKLREIDRRLGWLSRRMKAAKIVDPKQQPDRDRIFFGATVTIADEDDHHRALTLVGDDEADAGKGLVGWNSPIARALRGASTGDLRRGQTALIRYVAAGAANNALVGSTGALFLLSLGASPFHLGLLVLSQVEVHRRLRCPQACRLVRVMPSPIQATSSRITSLTPPPNVLI